MNDKYNTDKEHKQCDIDLTAAVIFACGTRKFRQIILPAAIMEQAKQHLENDGAILSAENKNGDLIITLVRRVKREAASVTSSNALSGRADKDDTDKLAG